jgi:predicted transcriptional regulator
MTLTEKQREILNILLKGNPDGSWVDMDQLLDRLSYETSKPSIQYSVRTLMKKKLMERKDLEFRRGAWRRVLAPTIKAYELLRGA